jgi:hypothetical protein
MFNFDMFKSKKSEDGLVKEVMNNKTEKEKFEAQKKIDSLAFQKALLEIIDGLSEEDIKILEESSSKLGQEKFAENVKEKYPDFNNRLIEIKQELNNNLEASLEEVNGINTDTAGRVGELAFRSTMNEIISQSEDKDIEVLNAIMKSDLPLEEKMKLTEKIIPNFQEVLKNKSEETADDLNRLTKMTMEKVAKIKKEREVE